MWTGRELELISKAEAQIPVSSNPLAVEDAHIQNAMRIGVSFDPSNPHFASADRAIFALDLERSDSVRAITPDDSVREFHALMLRMLPT